MSVSFGVDLEAGLESKESGLGGVGLPGTFVMLS